MNLAPQPRMACVWLIGPYNTPYNPCGLFWGGHITVFNKALFRCSWDYLKLLWSQNCPKMASKLPKNDLKIAQNFLTLSESLLRKQVRGRLIFEHPDLQWISSFSFLRWNLSFLRKHPLKHNYISGFMWLFFFGFTR